MKNRFVVVDLETTGNSPKKGDRIIQIAAVVIEDGEICERFASFVNPERAIPPFIEQLTGISDDVVRNAPSFDALAPEIATMLENAYFVAHNVPFDLSFLQEELKNSGQKQFEGPAIDTVELSRIMMPWADSYKLNQLAESFSLAHENPHQADSDAEVTAEILLKILEKLVSLPLVTCQKLRNLAKYLKSNLLDIFDHVISTKMGMANDDQQKYDHYRGFALAKQKTQFHNYDTEFHTYSEFKNQYVNEANGKFFNNLAGFDYREGQLKMMDFVNEALESNQHGIVEAGTGIGKTLGYLIPSYFFSRSKSTPVVISTNTIQLQQQLIEHDLPILQKILKIPVNFALLKGKSHYLSLRKFEQALYEIEDNYDSILAKAQILVWLTETETGDVDEINLPSGGRLLWNRVSCDFTDAKGVESPWETRCFYNRAHDKARDADLIITNHALLFSDHCSELELIPPYEHVVIDEAHHLERVATQFFGDKMDYLFIHHIISQIGTLDSQDLLSKAYSVLRKAGFEDKSFRGIDFLIKDLKGTIDDLFRMIRSYVIDKSKKTEDATDNLINYSITTDTVTGENWREILKILSNVNVVQKDLINLVDKQMKKVEKIKHMVTPIQLGTVSDYFSLIQVMDKTIRSLNHLLYDRDDGDVIWIEAEIKGAKNATTIHNQPISVSDYLADSFFTNKKSAILTSATLTVNDSFEYSLNRFGLEDFAPLKLMIPSPFDYKKQAVLMIPTDLPDINTVSIEEYVHAVTIQIAEIALKTQGRMLVLFTSYDMLKLAHEYLKDTPFLDDFMIISQGVSGRSKNKLTKNFKAFNKAILLGTSSFWEGIDIPGDDLTALVIVRLPFTPPADPIFAAKYKKIKGDGGNPFKELALPEAIMRFKQGFGRLVRTKTDRGIVFIMDRRIISTKYGKNFILSLPEVTRYEEPLDSLLTKVDTWLK